GVRAAAARSVGHPAGCHRHRTRLVRHRQALKRPIRANALPDHDKMAPSMRGDMHVAYWLMKTEPDTFSIDDLARRQREPWNGVRNYQARNFMRDDMKVGDGVFIYHSSCAIPGIAGVGEVLSDAYPDPSQFEKKGDYYDPASKPEEPRWWLV